MIFAQMIYGRCELSLDKTEASITSMQLLTHMLICTNTVSCLKINWNLDALFFRLKTVCNKKKIYFCRCKLASFVVRLEIMLCYIANLGDSPICMYVFMEQWSRYGVQADRNMFSYPYTQIYIQSLGCI